MGGRWVYSEGEGGNGGSDQTLSKVISPETYTINFLYKPPVEGGGWNEYGGM